MSPLASVKDRFARLRQRSGLVDHLVRTVERYNAAQGSQQAGGVTYFGFLSVFPLLALSFFAVGWVAKVYPDAQDDLLRAIDTVLPGLIGNGEHDLSLDDVESAAGRVGLVGVLGLLYAGLGWVGSMRAALTSMFELPKALQPGLVKGRLRDLATLAVLGSVLLLSVGLSGVVTRVSGALLDLVGLASTFGWLLALMALVLGIGIGTLLFFLMFRLLTEPPASARSLWSGALLGAVGFELLKQASGLLLTSTRGQPAFQAFGIALILLVWINYFSRVVLLAAAWAHTDAPADPGGQESENP